jgi:hypothetical protein
VLEHDSFLHVIEGNLLGFPGLLLAGRVLVQEPFHDPSAQNGLAEDLRHVRLLHQLVQDPLGLDHHDRASLA